MSDDAPDFAMLRAVEILAKMHERVRRMPSAKLTPLDRPIVLFNENLALALGQTQREDVEQKLGVGFSYPVRGYHTYAIAGERNERLLLSLFYRDGVLFGAELYRPTTDRAPTLQPHPVGTFRLVPGDFGVGRSVTDVPDAFTRTQHGPAGVVYKHVFEARFPGGVAYAMARLDEIERLALYSERDAEERR